MISYSRPNSLYPTLNCLKTKAFSVARTHVVILDNNCISRSDSARSETERNHEAELGFGDSSERPTECRKSQNYERFPAPVSRPHLRVVPWSPGRAALKIILGQR